MSGKEEKMENLYIWFGVFIGACSQALVSALFLKVNSAEITCLLVFAGFTFIAALTIGLIIEKEGGKL